jgi:uncharacterized protein (DUF3084 family)
VKIETPLVLGALSFLAAVITAFLTARNAGKANKTAEGHQQLAWTQEARSAAREAMEDASGARKEAKEARAEAEGAREEVEQARDDLAAARRETRQMTSQIAGVMDWVDRVVRYAAEMRTDQINDPKTIRLLAIINGGPAEISGSRLPRPTAGREDR